MANRLPSGRAHANEPLAQRLRYRANHLTADGNNHRNDHDGEHHAGAEDALCSRCFWIFREPRKDASKGACDPPLDRVPKAGREIARRPEPDHHGRNRGHELDEEGEWCSEASRCELNEVHRGQDADWCRNHDRNERGDYGSPDHWEGSVIANDTPVGLGYLASPSVTKDEGEWCLNVPDGKRRDHHRKNHSGQEDPRDNHSRAE